MKVAMRLTDGSHGNLASEGLLRSDVRGQPLRILVSH